MCNMISVFTILNLDCGDRSLCMVALSTALNFCGWCNKGETIQKTK